MTMMTTTHSSEVANVNQKQGMLTKLTNLFKEHQMQDKTGASSRGKDQYDFD